MSDPRQQDPTRRARLDDILSRVQVLRLSGQTPQALEHCAQALELSPECAEALELRGDLLSDLMRHHEALEAYQAARKLEPHNARLEEKYGLACLRVADEQSVVGLDASLHAAANGKNRPDALKRALLFPGGGHYYLGEREKGLILAAAGIMAAMACWVSVVAWIYPTPGMLERGQWVEKTIFVAAVFCYLGLVVYSVLDVVRLCRVYFPVRPPWMDVIQPPRQGGAPPSADNQESSRSGPPAS